MTSIRDSVQEDRLMSLLAAADPWPLLIQNRNGVDLDHRAGSPRATTGIGVIGLTGSALSRAAARPTPSPSAAILSPLRSTMYSARFATSSKAIRTRCGNVERPRRSAPKTAAD